MKKDVVGKMPRRITEHVLDFLRMDLACLSKEEQIIVLENLKIQIELKLTKLK